MNSDAKEKAFDCMKWLRETRDQIYEETKDMTREEWRAWYSQRPTDPILARLFDLRKVSGSGTAVRGTGPMGQNDE